MKILDRVTLLERRQLWRSEGRVVVWTNGCFDLFHVGHLASLTAAKALGHVLVVGVNSDLSVSANKGPSRPILSQEERATLLAGLACVDAVHVFEERTPNKVLSELKPDIHCKGAEYAMRAIPEAAVVEAYGGRIAFLTLVPGVSTTDIIARIHRSSLTRAA